MRRGQRGFLLQAVRDNAPSDFVATEAVMAAGVASASIARVSGDKATSLYLDAAVTQVFLNTPEGKELLRQADHLSSQLLDCADLAHKASSAGSAMCFSWLKIRKIHPAAPAQLYLWGREKYTPASTCPGVCKGVHIQAGCWPVGQIRCWNEINLFPPMCGLPRHAVMLKWGVVCRGGAQLLRPHWCI